MQNPLPTGNILWDVVYINSNEGWAVGQHMTILKTTDGGYNWKVKSSASSDKLYSVSFIDDKSGLAVGTNGIILKTTDGGNDWALQNSGTTHTLCKIY